MPQVAIWDYIEGSRVIQDVVVQGEFAAEEVARLTPVIKSNDEKRNLGMRSTLAALRPVQDAFLTSAAAFVSSSAEILPAQ